MVLTDNGTPGGARLKFVDFGGAADLRIGLNYAPKEYLMDPRFAPPEQYIMSTQTAEPPAVPVALVLSPILWQLNLPDRFDMWSAGLVLLQMCLPSLRPDNSLIAMRRFLDRHDQDVVVRSSSCRCGILESLLISKARSGCWVKVKSHKFQPHFPLRSFGESRRRSQRR